jgi:ribosomal protein S18 acetylase RimI-like enzyme
VRTWRAGRKESADVARLLIGFRDWMGRSGDEPPDASIRMSVERLMARDDTEYLLGAVSENDPPAGVVQLRFRWGIWWAAEDCWLEDLFIEESARGSGLGRALVEATLERARERGCRRVELDVNTENAPALALYRSVGFETGKDGTGQDLMMRRRL